MACFRLLHDDDDDDDECVFVCLCVCYGLMPEINVHSFIHSFGHFGRKVDD